MNYSTKRQGLMDRQQYSGGNGGAPAAQAMTMNPQGYSIGAARRMESMGSGLGRMAQAQRAQRDANMRAWAEQQLKEKDRAFYRDLAMNKQQDDFARNRAEFGLQERNQGFREDLGWAGYGLERDKAIDTSRRNWAVDDETLRLKGQNQAFQQNMQDAAFRVGLMGQFSAGSIDQWSGFGGLGAAPGAQAPAPGGAMAGGGMTPEQQQYMQNMGAISSGMQMGGAAGIGMMGLGLGGLQGQGLLPQGEAPVDQRQAGASAVPDANGQMSSGAGEGELDGSMPVPQVPDQIYGGTDAQGQRENTVRFVDGPNGPVPMIERNPQYSTEAPVPAGTQPVPQVPQAPAQAESALGIEPVPERQRYVPKDRSGMYFGTQPDSERSALHQKWEGRGVSPEVIDANLDRQQGQQPATQGGYKPPADLLEGPEGPYQAYADAFTGALPVAEAMADLEGQKIQRIKDRVMPIVERNRGISQDIKQRAEARDAKWEQDDQVASIQAFANEADRDAALGNTQGQLAALRGQIEQDVRGRLEGANVPEEQIQRIIDGQVNVQQQQILGQQAREGNTANIYRGLGQQNVRPEPGGPPAYLPRANDPNAYRGPRQQEQAQGNALTALGIGFGAAGQEDLGQLLVNQGQGMQPRPAGPSANLPRVEAGEAIPFPTGPDPSIPRARTGDPVTIPSGQAPAPQPAPQPQAPAQPQQQTQGNKPQTYVDRNVQQMVAQQGAPQQQAQGGGGMPAQQQAQGGTFGPVGFGQGPPRSMPNYDYPGRAPVNQRYGPVSQLQPGAGENEAKALDLVRGGMTPAAAEKTMGLPPGTLEMQPSALGIPGSGRGGKVADYPDYDNVYRDLLQRSDYYIPEEGATDRDGNPLPSVLEQRFEQYVAYFQEQYGLTPEEAAPIAAKAAGLPPLSDKLYQDWQNSDAGWLRFRKDPEKQEAWEEQVKKEAGEDPKGAVKTLTPEQKPDDATLDKARAMLKSQNPEVRAAAERLLQKFGKPSDTLNVSDAAMMVW